MWHYDQTAVTLASDNPLQFPNYGKIIHAGTKHIKTFLYRLR